MYCSPDNEGIAYSYRERSVHICGARFGIFLQTLIYEINHWETRSSIIDWHICSSIVWVQLYHSNFRTEGILPTDTWHLAHRLWFLDKFGRRLFHISPSNGGFRLHCQPAEVIQNSTYITVIIWSNNLINRLVKVGYFCIKKLMFEAWYLCNYHELLDIIL